MTIRRAPHKHEVSTFPFLAVLLCAMGALIFLLMVMDRRSKIVARHKLEAKRLEDAEARERIRETARAERDGKLARALVDRQGEWEMERDRLHRMLLEQERELRAQLAGMTKEIDSTDKEVQKRDAYVEAVKGYLTRENARLLREYQELMRKKQQAGLSDQQGQAVKGDLQRLTIDVLRMERTLKELRDLKSRPSDTYSLIPYSGKYGDKRKPVYVECSAGGLMLYPNRTFLSMLGLNGERFRQEVETRAGALEVQKKIDPSMMRGPPPTNTNAYVLFLVRPDGIMNYLQAQRALDQYAIDYGYELVDANWEFHFGNEDLAAQQPWQRDSSGSARNRPAMPASLSAPSLALTRPGWPGSGSGVGLPGPPGSGVGSASSGLPGPPGSRFGYPHGGLPGPPGSSSGLPGPPGSSSGLPGPPGSRSGLPGPPGSRFGYPDGGSFGLPGPPGSAAGSRGSLAGVRGYAAPGVSGPGGGVPGATGSDLGGPFAGGLAPGALPAASGVPGAPSGGNVYPPGTGPGGNGVPGGTGPTGNGFAAGNGNANMRATPTGNAVAFGPGGMGAGNAYVPPPPTYIIPGWMLYTPGASDMKAASAGSGSVAGYSPPSAGIMASLMPSLGAAGGGPPPPVNAGMLASFQPSFGPAPNPLAPGGNGGYGGPFGPGGGLGLASGLGYPSPGSGSSSWAGGQMGPGQASAALGAPGSGNPGSGNPGQGFTASGNPNGGNPGQGFVAGGNPGTGIPGQGNLGSGSQGGIAPGNVSPPPPSAMAASPSGQQQPSFRISASPGSGTNPVYGGANAASGNPAYPQTAGNANQPNAGGTGTANPAYAQYPGQPGQAIANGGNGPTAGAQGDGRSGGGSPAGGAGGPSGNSGSGGVASAAANASSAGGGDPGALPSTRPPPPGTPPGKAPPGEYGPVNTAQDAPSIWSGYAGGGSRSGQRPPATPSQLRANHDFIINLVCWADGVVLNSTNEFYAIDPPEQQEAIKATLVQRIRAMIDRRQATVREGEPPYQPMIKLVIRPEGGYRGYYWILPALRTLNVPMSRENPVN